MADDEHAPLRDAPWRVPPEKRERYEHRQGAWEDGFPFEQVAATRYAIGASANGELIGFEFGMPDGRQVRASLPTWFVRRDLFCSLMLAFERAELKGAKQPEGKAS